MFLTRRNRARQRALNSLREWVKHGRVLPPSVGLQEPVAYISLPALDIPKLAAAYAQAMESEETDDWCRCVWQIHPDDMDKPKGKRRKRRVDDAPDCPVHTKEGMLIYFLEWVFTRGKN